jgi:hypothetical protein
MKTRNPNEPRSRSPPLRLDAVAVDIMQRLIAGKELWIRPEFRGLWMPTLDLVLAAQWVLGRLKELDAGRKLTPKERRARAVDLDRTAQELRKMFRSLGRIGTVWFFCLRGILLKRDPSI